MGARGFDVWLDTAELRFGDALTGSLQTSIESVDVMIVIASQASADSKWVGLELEHARKHNTTVIPLFIEAVQDHARFHDDLGVDATFAPRLGGAIRKVMLALAKMRDLELPAPDRDLLETGLRQLAVEEPDVSPLIVGCLEEEGLRYEHVDNVCQAGFHPLDAALDALFEHSPTRIVAYAAATTFSRAGGAGFSVLGQWVNGWAGDDELVLISAVGACLADEQLQLAIELLTACSPPNNHALYQFIAKNGERFGSLPPMRRAALRLITVPVRGPERFGDVLGQVAMRHFHDSPDLLMMWRRWIFDGHFDGEPCRPTRLAQSFALTAGRGEPGWEPIHDVLRQHVRAHLRSGDERRVDVALEHLRAQADAASPAPELLLRETSGVSGTAEWDDWRAREPEIAERMNWHVHFYDEQARTTRKWLLAYEEAERMSQLKEQRRTLSVPDESEAE